jgi:hypothetical protein
VAVELEESGEEGQVHVRGVDDPAFLKLDQSQMPLQVWHILRNRYKCGSSRCRHVTCRHVAVIEK